MTKELLRDLEEMLNAQKLMLRRCEQQIERRDRVIRELMALAGEANIPTLKIAAAVAPLFEDTPGAIPTQEQPIDDTKPLEEVEREEEARREGRPTVRVQSLSMRALVSGEADDVC